MMDGLEKLILSNWTPGGAGVWVLVIFCLIAWWKALPAVIDAISNRRSKIEERLGAEMDAMAKRFTEQIAAADSRHDDCIRGQTELQQRITAQDGVIAQQNDTIARQSNTIVQLSDQVAGLKTSNQQLQMSLASSLSNGESRAIDKALDTLKGIQ